MDTPSSPSEKPSPTETSNRGVEIDDSDVRAGRDIVGRDSISSETIIQDGWKPEDVQRLLLVLGGIVIAILVIFALLLFGVFNSRTPTPTTVAAINISPTALPQAGTVSQRGNDNAAMVYVPAGEFTMGSSNSDSDAASAEKPQHQVYLDAFWLDQYEVTNALYKKCVDTAKCSTPNPTSSNKHDSYFGDSHFDNYPVIYVSWNDADAYCMWADKRLPTEGEWEKAARGTDGRIYPWGNEFDQSRVNSNNVVGDTAEVGKYPAGASPYGAQDMAGNVWEWVNDWYDENYYQTAPARNPVGPASGQSRVLRGGSWYDVQDYVRVALRDDLAPDNRDLDIGFRCAQ